MDLTNNPSIWDNVIAVFLALVVLSFALVRMSREDMTFTRKRSLGALVALLGAYVVLEIRWVIKPVPIEYDDIYWSIWQCAVFIYMLFALIRGASSSKTCEVAGDVHLHLEHADAKTTKNSKLL